MFSNAVPASRRLSWVHLNSFCEQQQSTTLPAINLLKLTLPCGGNRAPATICRLSVEVLRSCKEIDCFYKGDKPELSWISLSSFRELHGGKEGKHSAASGQHSICKSAKALSADC
jgi:hypothetical protein